MKKTYQYGEYTVQIEYNKEKYGLSWWDYEIQYEGKVVAFGVDRTSSYFDEQLAIMEFLMEDACSLFGQEESEKRMKSLKKELLEKFEMEELDESLAFDQKESIVCWVLAKSEKYEEEFNETVRFAAISEEYRYAFVDHAREEFIRENEETPEQAFVDYYRTYTDEEMELDSIFTLFGDDLVDNFYQKGKSLEQVKTEMKQKYEECLNKM